MVSRSGFGVGMPGLCSYRPSDRLGHGLCRHRTRQTPPPSNFSCPSHLGCLQKRNKRCGHIIPLPDDKNFRLVQIETNCRQHLESAFNPFPLNDTF